MYATLQHSPLKLLLIAIRGDRLCACKFKRQSSEPVLNIMPSSNLYTKPQQNGIVLNESEGATELIERYSCSCGKYNFHQCIDISSTISSTVYKKVIVGRGKAPCFDVVNEGRKAHRISLKAHKLPFLPFNEELTDD